MSTGPHRSIPLALRRTGSVPLRRRDFLFGAAAIGAGGLGCTRSLPPRAPGPICAAPLPVELWSFFDLPPEDTRSRELSGIAWDNGKRVLWAVHDESPSIVALIPDRDLRTWSFGESIPIDITGALDLEGLVILEDGFIVCSEIDARVVEVDKQGRFRRELTVSPHLREARTNKSLESLTMSPSGRYLFTTTEAALTSDGARATPQAGTRVRLVRLDRVTGELTEYVYETDAVPYDCGDWGVADMSALGDEEVFVLERGWSKGRGNTARIYQTTLHERASCSSLEHLSTTTPVLAKTLRVDLSALQAAGLPAPKQPQPAPLLDNYEGIALGPTLPNGRPSLLMVSDDNGRADQFARVLVLGL